MKITPAFLVALLLCAAPFALAVYGDIKHKDDKSRFGFGDDDEYDPYREEAIEARERALRDYEDSIDSYGDRDIDDTDTDTDDTASVDKQDLLQLVGPEPATMGPVLDGIRLGAPSDDFQPDTTRERIYRFVSDHDYKIGVDFDFDDYTLNGVTVTVTGDEGELRDVMISAWGNPRRLSEDELVWLGPTGTRALYSAKYDGFTLKFETAVSADDFIAPGDKAKLGFEPFPLVGGSVRKLRDALGTRLQEGYDDLTFSPTPIATGTSKPLVNVTFEGDKITSMRVEASTADTDAISAALTAKWGAPKEDADGYLVWKNKGVTYRFEPYGSQGFLIEAQK